MNRTSKEGVSDRNEVVNMAGVAPTEKQLYY